MAFIYKISNSINDKVYIGCTTKSIEERMQDHKSNCNNTRRNHRPIYAAMNELGVENFTIEEIAQVPDEERFQKETEYIAYYDSFHNGYNDSLGGAGKPQLEDDVIVEMYEQYQNINEVARQTGFHHDSIRNCLRRNGIAIRHSSLIARDKGRAVNRYTPDGVFIATYPSVSYAAKCVAAELGLSEKATKNHIPEACDGVRRIVAGSLWEWAE